MTALSHSGAWFDYAFDTGGSVYHVTQKLTDPPVTLTLPDNIRGISVAMLILEEGYALRAADIDTIYLAGYGFPGYRGGPMWYADHVGLKKIFDRILAFQREHGELWEPAPLLKRLAEGGGTFAEWDAEQEKRFAAP